MRNVYAVSLTAATLLAFSTLSHGENLRQAYDQAVSNDPVLQQAEAANRAAQEIGNQATANFRPRVDLGAGVAYVDTNTGDGDRTSVSLTVNQSLYNRSNNAQSTLAEYSIKAADAELEAARQALMVRVSEAYFAALSAEDNLEFARAERQAIARQLEQTRQRFEVGLVAITDVHESQARHDLAVAQEIAAVNQQQNAREDLRTIIGRYPESLAVLTDGMPLVSPDPDNIDSWTKAALDGNLLLRAARQTNEQARQNVDLVRSGRYPTVGAYASFDSVNSDDTFSDGETTTLGVQLDWNLYNGGALSSRIRESQQLREQSSQALEELQRATQRQARSAFLGVLAGISRVKALKQAVVSSESALKATEAGYEVGTRTNVDVLDARRGLFLAQRDYAQARYSYLLDSLRLKQAAGSLSVQDVDQINRWLK